MYVCMYVCMYDYVHASPVKPPRMEDDGEQKNEEGFARFWAAKKNLFS